MRVIFHAGLHKTASSSFQEIGKFNQEFLLQRNIFFPVVKNSGNMFAAVYLAQNGDWSLAENIFRDASRNLRERGNLRNASDGTLVFSSEDLENALYDISFGKSFMRLAERHGFTEINWFFVTRAPFDYFESLYSQMSKNGQLLRYDLMAHQILNNGVFSCAIPAFRWYFIFEFSYFRTQFLRQVTGLVYKEQMSDFVSGFPGKSLLHYAGLDEQSIGTIGRRIARYGIDKSNMRLSPKAVEWNYMKRFLGLPTTTDIGSKNSRLLQQLVEHRLEDIEKARQLLMEKFTERFPNEYQ